MAQVYAVMKALPDDTQFHLEPEPEPAPEPEPETARTWLGSLGFLCNEQIDEAVAYTQEEGEPTALLEMDTDDFDEMVEQLELGEHEHK